MVGWRNSSWKTPETHSCRRLWPWSPYENLDKSDLHGLPSAGPYLWPTLPTGKLGVVKFKSSVRLDPSRAWKCCETPQKCHGHYFTDTTKVADLTSCVNGAYYLWQFWDPLITVIHCWCGLFRYQWYIKCFREIYPSWLVESYVSAFRDNLSWPLYGKWLHVTDPLTKV